MTYEKFEHTAIKMLLTGDDPRLAILSEQASELEILAREKTEKGFNIKYWTPYPQKITEAEGRIFGVEARFSDTDVINLELVIKDGFIERLKGTFTADFDYSEVVNRGEDLEFIYKNEASEFNFHSDNHDHEEVTFVKGAAPVIAEPEIIEDSVADVEDETLEEVELIEEHEVAVATVEEQDDEPGEPALKETSFEVEGLENLVTEEDVLEGFEEEFEDDLEEETFEPLIEEPFTLHPIEETIDEVDRLTTTFPDLTLELEDDELIELIDEPMFQEIFADPELLEEMEHKVDPVVEVETDVADDTDKYEDEDDDSYLDGRGTGVLSSISDEDVDEAIEMMMAKNATHRKNLTLIVLITILVIALIMFTVFG